MAPVNFHLLALQPSVKARDFLSKLKGLVDAEGRLWFGQVHHWMHEPQLSADALLGSGSHVQKWDYLLVSTQKLPADVEADLEAHWSVAADAPDGFPSAKSKTEGLLKQEAPKLPRGWSASDHSGLDASTSSQGLNFSLHGPSRPMGVPKSETGGSIKDFVKDFGAKHPGPVVMFNLLSYLPGGRSIYFDGYVGGFIKTLGPLYGGEALQFGWGVSEWSSQAQELGQEGRWEDLALVWYPSIWHFAKMIDDDDYVKLDREFKPISLRDNTLACCTEVEL
jgi:hypothetical protein